MIFETHVHFYTEMTLEVLRNFKIISCETPHLYTVSRLDQLERSCTDGLSNSAWSYVKMIYETVKSQLE